MAREKSLSDIDKRIEELKKQKEKVVNDLAIGFARKVINEQQISTKRDLNEWYERAKGSLEFAQEIFDKQQISNGNELNEWYEKATEAIKFYDDFQEQSEKKESYNVLV